jgi:hypothetical protein
LRKNKVKKSREGLLFICLTGEPGAGKSTLAWRLAAEYASETKTMLLHLRDNESGDAWYDLEAGLKTLEIPAIILVDDVFRDYSATNSLGFIDQYLDLIILSTSRKNEIPPDIRFDIDYFELRPPSIAEKDRTLKSLNLDEASLKPASRKRFHKANSWWVMMLELTTGEALRRIVIDVVQRLHKKDPIGYHAFEYLCFAGQYDIDIPVELMSRLDDKGHFYDLSNRPFLSGLVFENNDDRGRLHTLQATFAKTAFIQFQRDPTKIASELITVVSPKKASEP